MDAIVWVKPGGECDGTSDQSSSRYDTHCGQSDSTKVGSPSSFVLESLAHTPSYLSPPLKLGHGFVFTVVSVLFNGLILNLLVRVAI